MGDWTLSFERELAAALLAAGVADRDAHEWIEGREDTAADLLGIWGARGA